MVAALLAFVLALLTARVGGDSMATTVQDGDALLVDRVGTQFQAPRRGDVVLAREANGAQLVKRVIGVPGDVLEIDAFYQDHPTVLVQPLGRGPWQRLVEPYLTGRWVRRDFCCDAEGRAEGQAPRPVTLPPNEFFLLGDNRNASIDSRSFGLVSRDRIIGRVLLRYWPLPRAGRLASSVILVPA